MAKGWPLIDDGVERTIPPSGNVQVSDGDALRTLAISGVGLVRLTSFIVREDIAANRLVPVLEEFNPQFLAERIKTATPRFWENAAKREG
jgi:DNA-binding transcriptional LysR family regulator